MGKWKVSVERNVWISALFDSAHGSARTFRGSWKCGAFRSHACWHRPWLWAALWNTGKAQSSTAKTSSPAEAACLSTWRCLTSNPRQAEDFQRLGFNADLAPSEFRPFPRFKNVSEDVTTLRKVKLGRRLGCDSLNKPHSCIATHW